MPVAVERFDIILHGYALMPNHYHLLVESTHGNLSRAMAFVSSTFSRRLDTRFHWDGSVFRGRYHNRVVTAPEHWHHLLAVAAWWLTHGAGLTNVQAGEQLAMSPVAVSKALRWVENQLASDAKSDVYRWIFLLKTLKEQ